jgi:hypothetical protein
VKLQAAAIANDCYKYVERKRVDEKIDALEEETTTNGVF